MISQLRFLLIPLFAFAVCFAAFHPVADAAPLVLQLKWTHQFQFAGYYAAIEKGYYREEGLDVVLKEGAPDIDIAIAVTSGKADFGIDSSSIVYRRGQGLPVVALATIMQHSPQAIVTRKESGILSPHELKGKRIMLGWSQNTDILAMLAAEGVDINSIAIIPHNWDPMTLVSGNIDAMSAYTTDQTYVLQKNGVEFNLIRPISYGIDYYGDCLFTSENKLDREPEQVDHFLRASLRGWEYAMSHEDEMIELISTKYAPSLSKDYLRFEAAEMRKLILPDFVEIGHMNPGRWSRIVENHQKFGLIPKNFTLAGFLYQDPQHAFYQRYFLPLVTVLGVLTLAILVFAAFNYRLKSLVIERTRRLEEKVDELREKERAIYHSAYHDSLTGLPNRRHISEQLAESIRFGDQQFAVIFLDLDDFKRINEVMGHTAGDDFLRAVAKRMSACLDNNDLLSRISGDEFLLLLPAIASIGSVVTTVEKCIQAISEPWVCRGVSFYISASAGIAIFPKDGRDIDVLLKAADMALYQAKRSGKHRYAFYHADMNTASLQRLTMENDLRQAIRDSEFVLHYQPQISSEGRIIGVEALVRWNHPTQGLLYPGAFIPLAEDTGMIIAIDQWVLNAACEQAIIWQKKGFPWLRISVNLSAKQFQHRDLVKNIRSVLEKTGLQANRLEMEITESVAIKKKEAVLPVMNALRNMGVRLALDDFGTGYSSFMYLKHYPIDSLKVDKSFINDLTSAPENQAIIEAILRLAKSFRFEVVAEGVETRDQAAILRGLECPILQGYLFSKPIPADKLETLLTKQFFDD